MLHVVTDSLRHDFMFQALTRIRLTSVKLKVFWQLVGPLYVSIVRLMTTRSLVSGLDCVRLTKTAKHAKSSAAVV